MSAVAKESPKDRVRRVRDQAESELRALRRPYEAGLAAIDRSAALLAEGAKLLVAAHGMADRGEVGRRGLSRRLAVARSARAVVFISSSLKRQVAAASKADFDVPESSLESFSGFVEKLGSAVELLEGALRDADAVRRAGVKLPPSVLSLVQASAVAKRQLERVSKRSRASLSAGSAAVEDSLSTSGGFD